MSILEKKRYVSKLEKCLKDLTDDSGDISSLNRKVDELQSSFRDFLVSDKTNDIVNRIDKLSESSQYSDRYISEASSYIRKEIAQLNKEITAETAAEEAAARAKALIGGSGMGGR